MARLFKSFNQRTVRYIGVVLLCAYSLLLCEEVFHADAPPPQRETATLNDGTSHFAHRIITESAKECAICQSAASQIHTATFHLHAECTSMPIGIRYGILKPQVPRLYSFSLRAPPACI